MRVIEGVIEVNNNAKFLRNLGRDIWYTVKNFIEIRETLEGNGKKIFEKSKSKEKIKNLERNRRKFKIR